MPLFDKLSNYHRTKTTWLGLGKNTAGYVWARGPHSHCHNNKQGLKILVC